MKTTRTPTTGIDEVFEYLQDAPLCMIGLSSANRSVVCINQTCSEQLAPSSKILHTDIGSLAFEGGGADDRDKLAAAIARVADGVATSAKVRNIRMLTLRDEKSGFPIKKYFDWIVGKGSDGQVIMFGDPCNEEDDEQRARDAELIDFFQHAPIALHWLSGEGKVLWANQTELSVLGYTAEEYIGQPIIKFCPDEEELVLEIFKQLGSGNSIRDVPVRFRAKDGHIVDLLIDSNVKYDSQGNFAHTRCFIRDDTKRKISDAKAKLLLSETQRSLNMMDNFMSRSMHHMRTPLHVLRNSTDLVLDHLETMKKAKLDPSTLAMVEDSAGILERCDAHVESAVSMINDTIDLARLDQGHSLVVAEERMHLQRTCEELLDSLDLPPPCTGTTRPTLEISAGTPDWLVSDAASLKKVIRHLFEHLASIPPAGEQGSLALRCYSQDRRHYFEMVNNTGRWDNEDNDEEAEASTSGLPPVFQRYQVEPMEIEGEGSDRGSISSLRDKIETGVNSLRENCTGIGLSLSYHIVAALGGDLRYCSSNGITKFWFSLPFKESLPSDSGGESVTRTLQTKKRRRIVAEQENSNPFKCTKKDVASNGVEAMDPPSVLVVEDTPVCAKLICRTLNKLSVPTQWVTNGQEAVDMLQEEGGKVFNLILMDLRMPVMDGFTATKIIKEDLHMNIPVIALTGETSRDVEKQCSKVGFDEVKQKPMKRKELISLVQEHTGYIASCS